MNKIVLMICGALLSWNASALDLAGIHLVDKMQMGNTVLELNGGGIRTKWFFKVYVAALYLPQKNKSAQAIIADDHEHRMVLYILRELSGKKLFGALNDALEANHTPAELSALDKQIRQMEQIFESVDEVKQNDIVRLDYSPASGTSIIVNGAERGVIAGAAFNRALLRVWLGKNPVQDDLKKGLLGG